MRKLFPVVFLLLAACHQNPESAVINIDALPESTPAPAPDKPEGLPFDVASDARARYHLLDVQAGVHGLIVATTRRDGPSGTTYARREIDCSQQTFRYVGEGDTLEEARNPSPNPGEMSTLVDGSIADVTVKFACAHQ